MYYGLFACTMYDSHGLELCTMYDSHDVDLRVLWTICIYKFSRYHIVVFHGFFFLFTDFWQNLLGFWQNSPRNRPNEFQENHQFIGEVGQLIVKIGWISVFWISTIPQSSPAVSKNSACWKNRTWLILIFSPNFGLIVPISCRNNAGFLKNRPPPNPPNFDEFCQIFKP
jgi:hypothetical protein